MVLVRPKLNDYYDLQFNQEQVEFAIPMLDEDIPLFLDPFLLWNSRSQQETSLHTQIINCFNHIGFISNNGREKEAIDTLIKLSECDEVGLGNSMSRKGKPIGTEMAKSIVSTFKEIPHVKQHGYLHIEEVQLLVKDIAKDRVSDIACSLIKSFLIDFTIPQCEKYSIPMERFEIEVYDTSKNCFIKQKLPLPYNPEKKKPIIFVPKRWLRTNPWINLGDYEKNFSHNEMDLLTRPKLLEYNWKNYDVILGYLSKKQEQSKKCINDPLFSALPSWSIERKMDAIRRLPTGKTDNADKRYEDLICQIMPSMLYPYLDFATAQSRTESSTHIRDLIFYNNRTMPILQDIYQDFNSRQIVMELKNVKELDGNHVNQLNRYLADHLGRFGIIITRNRIPRPIFQNTINLWSAHRKCIIVLDDSDIDTMCESYKSKQRNPLDIIKGKYKEFLHACPT